MTEGKIVIVNPDMFGKDPNSKTAKANEVAKSFDLSGAAPAEVEDFKAQFTKHNAWDLPFIKHVSEDGYGYAYVPGTAIVYDPYWGTHQAFLALPKDVQIAFVIRMLFTHRPIDRYSASMFLYYQHDSNVKSEDIGANQC